MIVDLLKQFLNPVAALWLLLLIGAATACARRKYQAGGFLVMLAGLLTLTGGSFLKDMLLDPLERPFLPSDTEPINEVDAVVVLGGYLSSGDGELHGFDASGMIDRLLCGVQLIRQGRASNLVLGGGSYIDANGDIREEALEAANWVRQFSAPSVEFFSLGVCENTRGEALQTQKLMEENGWSRILLVSSAFHLRRASAAFTSIGISLTPIGCDFHSFPKTSWSLIPSSYHFYVVSLCLKERIGYWVYSRRGWIKK